MMSNDQKVNGQIQAKEGLVIDQNGSNLGRMSIEKAFDLAQTHDADVVQVNENPVVLRIMKYEKYLYEMKKKQKHQNKPKHSDVIKEVKFTPQIAEHDILFKVKHANEFLDEGFRVKLTMFLGYNRRLPFKDIGAKVIKNVYERICGHIPAEGVFRESGNMIYAILTPAHKNNEKDLRGNQKNTSQKNERNEPARAF